jgi:hypothetical protein
MVAMPPTITEVGVTLTFNPANPTAGTPAANTYYGYCNVAQVKYLFTTNLTAMASGLTDSIIAEAITEAAIELQKQLEHFFLMPYAGSDPVILSTLMELNRKLAFANIYSRYFAGSAPDESPAAEAARQWYDLKITDIVNGAEQWLTPFGDATAQAMAPMYDLAAGASIMPNPQLADRNAATPIFSIGQTRYRWSDII